MSARGTGTVEPGVQGVLATVLRALLPTVRYGYPGTIVKDLRGPLVARWPAALVAVMVSVYVPGLSLFVRVTRPWKKRL